MDKTSVEPDKIDDRISRWNFVKKMVDTQKVKTLRIKLERDLQQTEESTTRRQSHEPLQFIPGTAQFQIALKLHKGAVRRNRNKFNSESRRNSRAEISSRHSITDLTKNVKLHGDEYPTKIGLGMGLGGLYGAKKQTVRKTNSLCDLNSLIHGDKCKQTNKKDGVWFRNTGRCETAPLPKVLPNTTFGKWNRSMSKISSRKLVSALKSHNESQKAEAEDTKLDAVKIMNEKVKNKYMRPNNVNKSRNIESANDGKSESSFSDKENEEDDEDEVAKAKLRNSIRVRIKHKGWIIIKEKYQELVRERKEKTERLRNGLWAIFTTQVHEKRHMAENRTELYSRYGVDEQTLDKSTDTLPATNPMSVYKVVTKIRPATAQQMRQRRISSYTETRRISSATTALGKNSARARGATTKEMLDSFIGHADRAFSIGNQKAAKKLSAKKPRPSSKQK